MLRQPPYSKRPATLLPSTTLFLVNLYLTPSGDIVLVETKLWRNSQMRREVVAQALDYVAALSRMGYEAFETAVTRGQQAPTRLYDLVHGHPEALDEAEFIDAVSLNLRSEERRVGKEGGSTCRSRGA